MSLTSDSSSVYPGRAIEATSFETMVGPCFAFPPDTFVDRQHGTPLPSIRLCLNARPMPSLHRALGRKIVVMLSLCLSLLERRMLSLSFSHCHPRELSPSLSDSCQKPRAPPPFLSSVAPATDHRLSQKNESCSFSPDIFSGNFSVHDVKRTGARNGCSQHQLTLLTFQTLLLRFYVHSRIPRPKFLLELKTPV